MNINNTTSYQVNLKGPRMNTRRDFLKAMGLGAGQDAHQKAQHHLDYG
jgi:hypothetical protein